MASLHRLATGALLDVTPRKFLSVSFSHSAVVLSAALSTKRFESPNVPEIFDIFDAPVKLRERITGPGDRLTVFSTPSTARLTSRAVPSHSESIHNDALGLPWSLPPPVTFDGPACPPHMSPLILERRRLQRENSTHSLRDYGPSAVSCSVFMSKSEPIYQLFDGPSRVTRYQYPTSRDGGYSFTYISLALCLSSAFGWIALKDNLDLLQRNNVRPP